MAKVLQLTFLTAGNKKVTLVVDEPKPNLTEEEVVATMETVIASHIFEVDAYPFTDALSAKIIDREVTELFKA